jgi:hypothetical protein
VFTAQWQLGCPSYICALQTLVLVWMLPCCIHAYLLGETYRHQGVYLDTWLGQCTVGQLCSLQMVGGWILQDISHLFPSCTGHNLGYVEGDWTSACISELVR